MTRLALVLLLLAFGTHAESGILKDGTIPTDVSRPTAPLTRGFRPPPPPPSAPAEEPSAGS